MENFNWVGLITALGGFGAAALFVREITRMFGLLRRGVAAKESTRRGDIVAQRDHALKERDIALSRAAVAEGRYDLELKNRRLLQTHVARLERQIILAGAEPPTWPVIDETTDLPKRT